jgi:hydrogenase nickel incorporation protein HypA/HybF
MHELSIARSIAAIVCELIPPSDRQRIRTIHVEVGEVSGVVADSLAFCFQAVAEEHELPPHALRIRHIPFRCRCRSCRGEFTNDSGIVICPSCGSTDTDVHSGRELRVATIEIEEPSHAPP